MTGTSPGGKFSDAKMEAERVKLGRRKILSQSGEVLCEGGVWGRGLRWDDSEAAALTDSLRE